MSESSYELCTRSARRLLVFARAPEHGKVKTRLAKDIGEDGAFSVYLAMIGELMERLRGIDEIDVEVLWSGSRSLPGQQILDTFGSHRLARQIGKDLGERMTTAFSERALLQRTGQILAIGTDLPDLERGDLDSAFALLESCDWVVGPASDGGYYLIGCRSASFDARVFEGIHWGESSVLEATVERIRELGESLAVLPERRDIDQVEDLFDYVEQHPDGDVARAVREIRTGKRSPR